jgi:glycosyltransferase involved in cell wall biosynthesis
LNWQINPNTGWGVLGLNLALQAELDQRYAPVPLVPTLYPEWLSSQHGPPMEKILAREKAARQLRQPETQGCCVCDFPVLHSLGNWLGLSGAGDPTSRARGTSNLGIIFFESTQFSEQALAAGRTFDLILAGSTWNQQVLRGCGLTNVETFLQGVDLSLFRPAPAPSGNRAFFVFSGGKLEFRKGQDLTVAAFRKFWQHHAEAILVTAWHNPWPKSMMGIDRQGHVSGCPAVDAQGRIDVTSWLEANGVPRNACHDIGLVPNYLMPSVYAQVDVAVLPNRCEGGTNLVAMECLACGIPTILSANTGHLDLVDERHCYPLTRQRPVPPTPPFAGMAGWGESDVDEMVELLERVYRDRAEAARRGGAASRFMQGWSWRTRYEELLVYLERVETRRT